MWALDSNPVTSKDAEDAAPGPAGGELLAQYPDVMTTEEVATVLRYSAQVTRRLAAKGEIPGQHIGRDWRFLKRDIIALLLRGN